MHIFISHSSEDSRIAKSICEILESQGHKCFIAPRDIRSGYEYAEEIVNGIDDSDMMLLLLSERANGSPHVLREVERAVSKNKSIIVYKLGEVKLSKSLEYFLMTHQWLDLEPGGDHSTVVKAINDYAAAHGEGQQIPEQNVPAVPEAPVGSKRNAPARIIIPAAAAAVVCAAAVIIVVNCSTGGIPAQESSVPSADAASSEVSDAQASASEQQTVPAPESAEASEESAATESASVTPEPQETLPSAAETVAHPAGGAFAQQTVSEPQTTSAEPQSAASEPEETARDIHLDLGSSVFLGNYNGEPIEWRVVRISDDGKTAVAVSDRIITMKAFDAAEGGSYNSSGGEDFWRVRTEDISAEMQREIRGDNRWELSNIRTWLNSGREMVKYGDQPPVAKAMSEHDNGYSTEPGFLRSFTADELSVIAETQLETNGTVTSDRVFLLSSDELEWLYDSDVSVYAEPSSGSLEQDTSGWYGIYLDGYGTKDYFWWLRDADSSCACRSHIVNISCMDERVGTQYVGLEGFGIRPAVTIDLTAEKLPEIMERTDEIS